MLRVWIEQSVVEGETLYHAMMLAAGTSREPALRTFRTEAEARSWAEAEAAELKAPIEWH